MENDCFDLIVIGGGPAGLSGAISAGILGKHVALIEKEQHVGGTGINTGTIPSRALRESALVISGWRTRKLLGIELSLKREATVTNFMRHENDVRDAMQRISGEWIQGSNVKVFCGIASFNSPHELTLQDKHRERSIFTGEKILIATGSSPFHPPEFVFEHPRIHDSNEILEIHELPKKLAVIGAGVIGAEYACTFASLGVEVHVVDGRDTLLPFLDHEVSAAITRGMIDAGIHFHWNQKVRGL